MYEGLSILKDIELVSPLPRIVRGVVIVPEDDSLEIEPDLLNGAAVEVIGIASPVTDKSEDSKNPFGYLDGDGTFVVVLPEQYNLKERVILRVFKDEFSQNFNFTATDILQHVKENKTLQYLQELRFLVSTSEQEDIESNEDIKALMDKANISVPNIGNIEREINYLLANDRLEAVFGEKGNLENALVLNYYVFTNISSKPNKVLPSVKLMEHEGEATYLPTDTAPSQIFTYSIMNRLTKPTIGQTSKKKTDQTANKNIDPSTDRSLPAKNEKGDKLSKRSQLTQSIDVMDFKKQISEDPNNWPQANSLAIGYILNMQQAWVPDGFALGNLLYSLVLAPGEEQRLIVREKKQSYSVTDRAQGKDYTSEDYRTGQEDNMSAAYQYALDQLSEGNSAMQYKTSSSSLGVSGSIAGSSGGIGGSLGIGYGKASSKGSASSSASQSNSSNEISNTAQSFQHGIKTASEKISEAQRLSVSMATSEESQSVATKIIANHNHSHTMTIQYWEVMRRYSLETCISGIELLLFVPLKLISFLNEGNDYILKDSNMSPDIFNKRYEILLRYADSLSFALPYKFRRGMELIEKYAALPMWEMENRLKSAKVYTLRFDGIFLTFDDIDVDMVLKNGRGV
ncbi:MAG: hypothetical protein QM308_02390, partial [Bacillota bacterium]|nr:hypothetical protein [Bacillota bacterium]